MNYPTISMRELDCWIMCGRPMELIDLRSRNAYEYSHLKGAVNIPYEELERMLKEGTFRGHSYGFVLCKRKFEYAGLQPFVRQRVYGCQYGLRAGGIQGKVSDTLTESVDR